MGLACHTVQQCIGLLREALPALQAVYLFGSEASGHAGDDSDIDLAVLLPKSLPAQRRWELSSQLAEFLGCDVDLIDLRAASTVMQYQVVQYGQRLWSQGLESDEFELFVLSEYWDLAIRRRDLIRDIQQRGSVYGR